jgi:transcriptional regulator with XRE-family HTH domain
MARTKNYADVLRSELAPDPVLAEAVEVECFNADVAMKVYAFRTEAGLTQAELAEKIGTAKAVISRIEDADYYGGLAQVLLRIAHALGKKVRVEFQSIERSKPRLAGKNRNGSNNPRRYVLARPKGGVR